MSTSSNQTPGYWDPSILGSGGAKGFGRAAKADRNTASILPAFLPGQQEALAQQLNWGFGGGAGKWNGLLSDTYSPVTMPPPFSPDPTVVIKKKPDDKDDPKKPDKPDKPDNHVTNTDDYWGKHQRAIAPMNMGQIPASGQFGNPQATMNPGVQAGQSMTQSPGGGGLLALNPQTLMLLRQMQFGGR